MSKASARDQAISEEPTTEGKQLPETRYPNEDPMLRTGNFPTVEQRLEALETALAPYYGAKIGEALAAVRKRADSGNT